MNLAAFNISFVEAQKLLEGLGLLKMKGVKSVNNDGVSSEFKYASLKEDYSKIYSIGKEKFDFDFLLVDESYFQFTFLISKDNVLPNIRYSFYQNPSYYKTYEEYIEQLRAEGIIESESVEEVGGVFLEEYDQFLVEAQLNSASTTIRYDVDPENYTPLVHSVSHFHIGHNNDIRIPCNMILSPVKFVLFVLKHIYYYQWKGFIESNNSLLLSTLDTSKNGCVKLEPILWVEKEEKELFIN